MSDESAANAAKATAIAKAAVAMAMRNGASSAIVFVGLPDGVAHSAFGRAHYGRTLESLGLLEHGYRELRPLLWFPVPATPWVGVSANDGPTLWGPV